MKIYRPLAVLLFALSCGLVAFAQDSSEITSLRAKAVKGNGIAQYNLGLAYAEGRGVAADPVEAFVWLSLARENGARGRALDSLVGTLNRATYEAAQKRLVARKAELGLKPATAAAVQSPVEQAVTPDTKPATVVAPAPNPAQPAAADDAALARLRTERDALNAQVTDLTANVTALRAERERMIKLSADHEKTARDAAEAGRLAQEQARASEARASELARAGETARADLERTRQALAALQSAPKPAADTSALDQKTRELQATAAELDASRKFGTQVEATLNRVTDQKTALESQLAGASNEANHLRQETAALTRARDEAQARLNAVAAEHTALQSEVTQLRSRPSAPAFPDLSGRVRELEAAVSAAKSAAPSYPNLSSRVSELEGLLAAARQPVAPRYPDLSGRVRELESTLSDAQRQLAAKPAAPAYPDLRSNVAALEGQLATAQQALAAKPAAPKYPDLSGRVSELESSLAGASAEATRAKQEMAALTKARDDAQRQLAAKPAAPTYPDLTGEVVVMKDKLAEAQQVLAELRAARSKPVVDPAALDQKNRELQAALAELEASRTFGRKVEDTLNKVNDEKARVAAAAAAELEAARSFGSQVESTLNKVTDQKTALESQLAGASNEANRLRQETAALNRAREESQSQLNAVRAEHTALQSEVAQLRSRPAAPAYPDLSGRVRELEASLAQARQPAAPAYPNLSGRVTELETALAAAKNQPAAPAAPDLSGRVRELEAALADASRQVVAMQNAKPTAPAYPNLSGRVTELEAAVATGLQKFGAAEQARAELSKQFDDYKSATITAQRERTTIQAQVKMLESDKVALRRQADAATAETGQLRTQVAALKLQQAAVKPAAPAYPDLSGRVSELETKLAAAEKSAAEKPAAPNYPDLSGRVRELETALAAKPAAPAYPDLSGRVGELESSLANAQRQLAAKPAAPAYPDLSGRVSELEGQLARARQPAAPRYPDLSGRVSELEAQVSANSSAVAAAKREAAALAQSNTEAQAQVASLTAERDNARGAQTELRDTIAKLAQEKVQLTAASKAAPAWPDLRDRVAGLESDLAASHKALAAKPAAPAYPDLSGRVGELETALTAVTTTSHQSAAELGRANEQIAQLKSTLAAKPAAPAYPDLSGRVSELESSLANAQRQLAAKPAAPAYPDLSGRVGELEAALAAARNTAPAWPDLSAKVGELEAKLAAAEKSATTRTAAPAYPDLAGRVTELGAEVVQLRTDRERMQKMLADAGRQLRDNTASANRIKELEAQIASRELQTTLTGRPGTPDPWGRIMELETKLAAAEKSAAAKPAAPAWPDLSGRVRELETAAADSARQLIAAEAATTGLKQQLAEASNVAQNAAKSGDDSARLRRERDELSGRMTELAGEVAQLRADRERMQKMLADAGRQLRDNTADTARIKDLETQLAGLQGNLRTAQVQASSGLAERDALTFESARAKQEIAALTQAREEARNTQNELRETIARLEREKPAVASARPTAPAYPDLSGRVRELEAQVAATPRSRAPAYPDLSGRVSELEAALALAEARQRPIGSALPAPAATGGDTSELQKKLADTEDRLATSLRGYALLEKDRDEFAARAREAAATVTAEKDALAAQVNTLSGEVAQLRAGAQTSAGSTQAEIARLNESLTALQRSTAQNSTDLAATRTLAQQLQGANAVLASENYQLKTMLSRTTGPTGTVAATPVPAVRTHVVASGDSLSRISQRYYGTAGRWQEIFNANTDRIAANGVLRIGTELRIP